MKVNKTELQKKITSYNTEITKLIDKLESLKNNSSIENARTLMVIKDQIMFLKGSVYSLEDILNNND